MRFRAKNVLAARALPWTPLWQLTMLPDPPARRFFLKEKRVRKKRKERKRKREKQENEVGGGVTWRDERLLHDSE